jgi:hypothetical protein
MCTLCSLEDTSLSVVATGIALVETVGMTPAAIQSKTSNPRVRRRSIAE